ncbi:ribosome maturation factor RimM [Acidilutibacter cellobiosedens]|jgi:16S rRNA processing protein RimM|uniref:Ribosome maturation factor RimM n=1 Tax=Acidilutibacter cellobiosedens TaxID=2507161 RepID=A0A410QC67_9FIRM|nr:ribosome maturation factor RimM [Acidilutibacter cellobiosedens]MBE6082469.1 ribosome maturation factor RimM [Tissierellaceae bacterium]QAT61585.1 ribosome maturation factor RimM [Acidilutibacter cellobiosedens]
MEWIQIGKIINTHGIKGEVRVYPLTDYVERFEELKEIYVGEAKLKLHISSVSYKKGIPILKFKEYDNINDVIKYKNEYIYIDEKNRVELPEGHYFIYEIIGCDVYDNFQNIIGKVKDVLQLSSNDVYVVKDKDSDKEYLIPAIKDVVKAVDIKNKRIIIKPMEGMIE